MLEKKQCKAPLLLGTKLSRSWKTKCEKRRKGLCCKDCAELPTCKTICSILYLSYNLENDSIDLDKFFCNYYLTTVEALIEKLKR